MTEALKMTKKDGFLGLQKCIIFSVILFLTGFSGMSQQLDSYLLEAEENNPEIEALGLRYEIAAEKINEAASLPDTEFSAGYFVSEPETRTGPQKARFSVRQMIPWFGTITARENYSRSLADAEYVEIATAKRKLKLSVAQNYYRLYAIQAKQEVVRENVDLLETYHELALNSVEVGSASAVDVLRLQMRQNELVQKLRTLEQDFEAEKVRFNTLLNRSENMDIMLLDSLIIPTEEIAGEVNVNQVHPELLKFDELYESISEAEFLNQKEALPKLGFGIDYIPVAERSDMTMFDNGKDILMPMLSVSIPIFNTKYRSVTRQNELRQKEINAQRTNRQDKLRTLLAEAVNSRSAARITAETFLQNLEQAKDAEEILLRSYETGTVDFGDVLDVQELQLQFQTGLIEAVRNFYQESAVINYLTN